MTQSEKSIVSAENRLNGNGEGQESLVDSFNKHYTDYLERYSTNRQRVQPESENNTDDVESEATDSVTVDNVEEGDLFFTPDAGDSSVDSENNETPVVPETVETETADTDSSAEVVEPETDSKPAPEGVEDDYSISLGDEEDHTAPVDEKPILEDDEDYFFSPEDGDAIEDEEDELGFYEPERPADYTPEQAPSAPEQPSSHTIVEREVVREVLVVDREQAIDLGYGADRYGERYVSENPVSTPATPSPSYTASPPVKAPAPTQTPSSGGGQSQSAPMPAPVRVERVIERRPETDHDEDVAPAYRPRPTATRPEARPAEKSSGFFGGLFKRGKDSAESDVSAYVSEVSEYKDRSRIREEGLDAEFLGTSDESNIISLKTQDNYDPREERRRMQHVNTEQREVDPASWLETTMLDALKMDASDLHIVVDGETKDLRARIRVDGQMQDFDYVTGIPAKVIMGRLKAATKLSSGGSFAPEETIYSIDLDGESRKARAVLFRVEDGGEALVMRLPLTGNLRKLDELAFSDENLGHVLDLLAMPYKLIMIAGPMGSGKGSPAWERILTPNGWTTYGEVKVGDAVVGSDGNTTEVTGVFPRGELDVYKVTFNDGSSVTVDGDHLWSVQSPDDRHEGRGYRTMETAELASKVLRNPKSNNAHKYFIPVVEPVQFAKQESALPVHPYVLGALLGDGTFEGRGVGFSTVDADFAAHVDGFLPDGVSLRLLDTAPSRAGKCPHYNLVGDGKKNSLLCTFREMGMLGKRSVEKFVPEEYLYASVEERLELLRGLMDSDGHAAKAGRAEFTSVSQNLAEAVVFVARSLGGIATMKERTTSYTNKDGEKVLGQLSYRVSVKLPAEFNPFRLARKRDAWVAPTKYPVTRAIASIEPAGRDEVICIQVEAENSLYVADHFIVTHNTTTAHGALLHVADPTRTVWTIEDPVERRLPNLVQLEIDEENGAGFDVLLSKLLRADYNTLFLGEIRDNATAAAAVRQAKAGRQVMSTIHADDNIKSLMRLIELAGDSPMSVLSAVGGVISQRLVRRLNPEWDGHDPSKKYKGRIPIHEILFVNDSIVEVMMQDRPLSEIKQRVKEAKGSTFATDAVRLINAGITDREEVVKVIGEFDADDRY